MEQSENRDNKPTQHNHSHAGLTSASSQHIGRLYLVLALTGTFLIVEVVGGLLTNSLALLADAGHMLTDVLGLALAVVAIKLGQRASSQDKTFGYYRTEILAALTNAVLLVLVAIYILYEAVQRFSRPPEVLGGGMLVVAVLGLMVNIAGVFILRGGAEQSLNMKGAYLEVLGDMLGSLGAIVAAIVIIFTGWEPADPIIGVGIGLFIIPRAYSLLKESVNVLMEGTPAAIKLDEVREVLAGMPGVVKVHDLHVWTITSGMYAMSGHVVVSDMQHCTNILSQSQAALHDRFDIEHTTIQVEPPEFAEKMDTHT